MLLPHVENQMSRALAKLHAGISHWDPLNWPMFRKAATKNPKEACVPVAEVSPRRAFANNDLNICYSTGGRIANAFSAAHAEQEERQQSEAWEEQLRHSRKMEEAGRLACGAVHDLSNLLTTIYGYSDLLAEQLSVNDRMREDVASIGSACERAMKLTRHLLAFSRSRAPKVRTLDLNKVIADFEPLLRGWQAGISDWLPC